jgi:CubicO group peptidase (beta-lactamase class C family)
MSDETDQVDELFAAWNKPDSPGCSLAVIKDGEIIYKRGYGMADLERNVPLSPASVFDIGSMGKQFTATLIALLARQGALSLGDSIRKHIPEMPAHAQPITIRHLIHQTSGIRDYTTLMYMAGMRMENFYYEEELLDLICRQKELNFMPGDEYLYCNTNYFLLGVIAKRATQASLPDLFREHILDPLGMKATGFNDDAGRIIKHRACGYSSAEHGYRNDMSFNGGFGDGMILSSVEDLFLWDQNFYHNQLGDGGSELIQEILTPGTLNNGKELDYAFGLWVGDYKGLRSVGHGGGWAGYRSDAIRFPEQKFSTICLANLSSIEPWGLNDRVADIYLVDYFTEGARHAVQEEASEYAEQAPDREVAVISPASLKDYVGVYHSDELNVFHKIILDGEQLCVRRGYSPPEALQPVRPDLFRVGELYFQFERDDQDRVCSFQIRAGWVKVIRFQRVAG